MKVVVAGGNHEADYIIKMLKEKKKSKVVVINDDPSICKYLSESNNISVICGDPTKIYVYEEAEVKGYDILISLCDKDADNYVVCKIAKDVFNIKKVICIVKNPNNVDVFEKLGIDSAISSTYLLSKTVQSETTLDELLRTSSMEDDKISITEVIINEDSLLVGKTLAEIDFPTNMTVGCIYRNPNVIIPRGNTMIEDKDKLLIISDPDTQKEIVKFFQKTAKGQE
ncbi:MAG: potassium channel family protein [Anaeroplasmataceae bacterium]